ncbi:MAG: PAC2 family protein, partial [Actinomycetota bacterium]
HAGTARAVVEEIGGIERDDLVDYRARRPVLDIVDGTTRNLVWPDLAIRHARVSGRDLLVLVGPEPDVRWRELGRDLAELALRLGVVEWISLGAIPGATPHTRPVPVLSTASAPDLLRHGETAGPPGLLRVPSAALSAVEAIANDHGIPSVGYYAQIPHYVGGPYPTATITLLEFAGRHLGVAFPTGDLADEAATQRERLDAAVAADEDSRAYVARLESSAGDEVAPGPLPSGDELAAEIERFLRGQAGGPAGGQPGGEPGRP